MSKHTPGPWKVTGVPHEEYWVVTPDSPEYGKQSLIAML